MEQDWGQIQIVNGEPSERILIIAPDLRHAQIWCRDHQINARSMMVKFVDHVRKFDSLDGLQGFYYVYLGTNLESMKIHLEYLRAIYRAKELIVPDI